MYSLTYFSTPRSNTEIYQTPRIMTTTKIVTSKNHEFPDYYFEFSLPSHFDKKEYDNCLRLVSALLNTSGGVIRLSICRSGHTPISLSGREFDKWQNVIKDQLLKFMTEDVYHKCICLRVDSSNDGERLFLQVHKSPVFTTFDSHMYTRGSMAETTQVRLYRDIVVCLPRQIGALQDQFHLDDLKPSYLARCMIPESQAVEFKQFKGHTVDDLIQSLSEKRTLRAILAFGNVRGGGLVILGVKEEPKGNVFHGQDLDVSEERDFVEKFNKLLEEDPHTKEKHVWGDPSVVPRRNEHWSCEFIPLGSPPYLCSSRCQNCPHLKQKVLIQIGILECLGGLFEKMPESFDISDEGNMSPVQLDKWRNMHQLDTQGHTYGSESKYLETCYEEPESREEHSPAGIYKDRTKIQYTRHSSHFHPNLPDHPIRHKANHKANVFQMDRPVKCTPHRVIIESKLAQKGVLQDIDKEMNGREAFAVASESLHSCITTEAASVLDDISPASHQTRSKKARDFHLMDLLVVDEIAQIFLFVICAAGAPMDLKNRLLSYSTALASLLKKKITGCLDGVSDFSSVQVHLFTMDLNGWRQACPYFYQTWFPPTDKEMLQSLKTSVAQVLSQLPTYFRDEVFRSADLYFSQEQIEILQSINSNRFSFIEGPPGCGKTYLAQRVCEMFGAKHTAYISPCIALNNFVKTKTDALVQHHDTSQQILRSMQTELRDKHHIIIDDNQNVTYDEQSLKAICELIARSGVQHVHMFQDSTFHQYHGNQEGFSVARFLSEHSTKYGSLFQKTMTEIHRNSQVVSSFIRAHVRDLTPKHHLDEIRCVSSVRGGDVNVEHLPRLREMSDSNELLKHISHFISESVAEKRYYTVRDIAILVDDEQDVVLFHDVFKAHWPESCVQGAATQPVAGVIIDKLDKFIGLEAKAVMFVVPRKERFPLEDELQQAVRARYKIAIASRAIDHVEFLYEESLTGKIAEDLKCDRCPTSFLKTARQARRRAKNSTA